MLQENEKNVLLWGPSFCGAPVRPNMLNMPKSASVLQCFDAVGWVIWPVKIVSEMTYKVSSGTLNLCSLTHSLIFSQTCSSYISPATLRVGGTVCVCLSEQKLETNNQRLT